MDDAHELETTLRRERTSGATPTVSAAHVEAGYRSVLRHDPTDADAHYELANFLRGEGREDETIRLLEAAVAVDPYHSAARSSLAYLLLAAHKPAQHRRGLNILSESLAAGMWPRGRMLWQHPAEYLPVVPSPPAAIHGRAEYDCILSPLERAAAAMGKEAAALLTRFGVQSEGLARPASGWREYEVWRRCGLHRVGAAAALRRVPNGAEQPTDPQPPELSATCAALRSVAQTNAFVHGASFSALAPGTNLSAHCGPTNGRLVLHVGLRVPMRDAATLRLGRPTTLTSTSESELRRCVHVHVLHVVCMCPYAYVSESELRSCRRRHVTDLLTYVFICLLTCLLDCLLDYLLKCRRRHVTCPHAIFGCRRRHVTCPHAI